MKKEIVIPDNILKKYFILHEEIKHITRFLPHKAFNLDTFDAESKINNSNKKQFYFYSTLSLGSLLISSWFGFYIFEQITFNPPSPENKALWQLSWKVATLFAISFLQESLEY